MLVSSLKRFEQMMSRNRKTIITICCGVMLVVLGPVGAQDPSETQDDSNKSIDSIKSEPPRKIRRADEMVQSFAELCEAYAAQKIKFKRNDENQTLIFLTKQGDFTALMVVKWDSSNGVVHFIQTMPLAVKEDQVDLYLKVSQTLNHAFLFPGLGVDLDKKGTYYRLSVPVAPRGYLFDYEVGTYTKFVLNKAAEFLPTIKAALNEEIGVDEVILSHKKHLKKLLAEKQSQLSLNGKYRRAAFGSQWVLDFTQPGVVRVSSDGEVGVVSNYRLKGNQITFSDKEGKLAAKEDGVYTLFNSNGILTFTLKNDPAKRRSDLLIRGPWKIAK